MSLIGYDGWSPGTVICNKEKRSRGIICNMTKPCSLETTISIIQSFWQHCQVLYKISKWYWAMDQTIMSKWDYTFIAKCFFYNIHFCSCNGLFPNSSKPLPEPMLTSLKVFCGIHLEASLQEVLIKLILNKCLGMTILKSIMHLQVMAWWCQAKAITWAKVDLDLCCYMASPGHNDLSWDCAINKINLSARKVDII